MTYAEALKERYARGEIDLEELEVLVEEMLRYGYEDAARGSIWEGEVLKRLYRGPLRG